jgi:hypothetical protein
MEGRKVILLREIQVTPFIGKASGLSADFTITGDSLNAVVRKDSPEGFLEFTCSFEADGDEYVLFPACCYKGNRFDVLKKDYPPLFSPEEAAVDMPVTITDVIRLEKDGSGIIEVTTGDLSTPCAGVFSAKRREGIFLFTIQEIDGLNLGLSYEKGRLGLTWPRMRKKLVYRWPHMIPASDRGIPFRRGKEIRIPYRLLRFPCGDIPEFYRIYFENRKCMVNKPGPEGVPVMDDLRPAVLSAGEQFCIQRDKFNAMNWAPRGGFYGVDILGTPAMPAAEIPDRQVWQPGWVGGAMSSYALMKLGGPLETERALATLGHLFRTQAPSGFFYESSDAAGRVSRMMLNKPGSENWHLLRKSADCLYFIFKHFTLMAERSIPIPPEWIEGTQKLADGFVKLWDRYGQFGQFVQLQTGEILAGGSTGAAIAPAALVRAFEFFKDRRYRETATAAAEQYYTRDALAGYTTGGPGEILQGPDSESAFALLESLVTLYESTGEPVWLSRSEYLAWFCSSWVVSYNYRFPPSSEFGRLGMKTTGAVFANVQNKHAAPGICTLSGDSLLKLYRWTGNKQYLELLKDIALSIGQYMSTAGRPIYSWDVPKDASLLLDDGIRAEREKLPQGFICERVNMSDWESERCIGGVFNGSCWCETSNLLALAELNEIYH